MKRFKAYVNYLMNFYANYFRIYRYMYVKDIPAITGMSNTETQFQWFPLLYSNLVAFVHEQDSRKHRQN